jgi:class 3 adenylate cyclase
MDQRIVRVVNEEGLSSHIKDVFLVCYDQIISRKISTVTDLMDYMDDLKWKPGLEKVVRKCFRLIRELHWGVFRDLDKDQFPELWKSLVIPNRRIKDIGDLKRNIQVPHTYCALMDIHAYTEFCQKHRHNFSMLAMLDGIIQKDIKEIARKNGCLSYRSAGDNILLIGCAAGDLLRASLGIVDCFSRRRVIKSTKLSETRKGTSIILQDIYVTAGIAGGQNYSSLIVTEGGDISGSIVNTAARLQGFANFLAPQRSKVLVTSNVYSGFLRENRSTSKHQPHGFEFFACGKVNFKGVSLSVHEVLYNEHDLRKMRYQKEYRRMLHTMQNGTWKERLIPDVMTLVIAVLRAVPIPRLEVVLDDEKKAYTSSTIISLCQHSLDTYRTEKDHRKMSDRLRKLLTIVELVHGFDVLVLIHLRQVVALFKRMAVDFESIQDEKILGNLEGLFSQKERKVIADAGRMGRARERLIERGKQNNNMYSTAMLWNKVISDYEKTWDFEVYSGKR